MSRALTFPVGPVLLLVALTGVALLTRPLTPIDETRYIGVAWEMWLRGDPLLLVKNGLPYSDKPPLLFWLINLGWWLGGVNEIWPRLISPLFSLGCLGLTAALARRLWPQDARIAGRATWILSSALLWMLFSTSLMFDVMLAFFALLGLRGLLGAAAGERSGFAWLAVAIGLGILAKGPVILLHLLPAALLLPGWQPGARLRRLAPGLLLALLGGVALALAWAIPAAQQGGEAYRQMLFWGQTAGRVANAFAHQRDWWWYLPTLPVLLFPWLLWPHLWRCGFALRRAGLDPGLRFCLAWLVPAFIVFSLISGKQIHYLIPLFPGFALLAARLLDAPGRSAPGSITVPVLATLAVGLALLHFAGAGLPGKLAVWQPLPFWPGIALVILALAAGWLARRTRHRVTLLAGLCAALVMLFQFSIAGNLWQRYDVRPMAGEIARWQARGIPVANDGMYHAQYQFFGRLQAPLHELRTPQAIQAWFAQHPAGLLLLYVKPQPGEAAPLFRQPYLGESVELVNADQLRARGLLQ